jgi:hypothetical protein
VSNTKFAFLSSCVNVNPTIRQRMYLGMVQNPPTVCRHFAYLTFEHRLPHSRPLLRRRHNNVTQLDVHHSTQESARLPQSVQDIPETGYWPTPDNAVLGFPTVVSRSVQNCIPQITQLEPCIRLHRDHLRAEAVWLILRAHRGSRRLDSKCHADLSHFTRRIGNERGEKTRVSANNTLLWRFQSHMFMVRAIKELTPDAAQVLARACREYFEDWVESHRRDQLFVARYGGGWVGDLECQFRKTSLPPIPSVLANIFPILSRCVGEPQEHLSPDGW